MLNGKYASDIKGQGERSWGGFAQDSLGAAVRGGLGLASGDLWLTDTAMDVMEKPVRMLFGYENSPRKTVVNEIQKGLKGAQDWLRDNASSAQLQKRREQYEARNASDALRRNRKKQDYLDAGGNEYAAEGLAI